MSSPKRKKRRRSGGERAVLTICILLFVVIGAVGAYRGFARPPGPADSGGQPSAGGRGDGATRQKPGTPFVREDSYYTILVSGVDDDNGGSDTNILVSIDAVNGEINAVSIPRDTLIDVTWNVRKINAAYNVGGIDRLQTELEKLLGIPVDFYISVDLGGFVSLVDAIGGVWFDVPVNMNYDDPVQDLHIHFEKGYQYLDGKDAIKVVRWRQNNDGSAYPNGDIGRIQTQQAFLTAVAQQMLSNLGSNPIQAIQDYVNLFTTYVDTDLTVGNLVWIGEQALTTGMENIHFYTLEGESAWAYGGSYYVLDPEKTLSLVNSSFNPYQEDRTLSDLDIASPN